MYKQLFYNQIIARPGMLCKILCLRFFAEEFLYRAERRVERILKDKEKRTPAAGVLQISFCV